MRIAFLGIGLLGGSIARALRLAPGGDDLHLVAWSPGGDGPTAAHAAGVIDATATTPGAAIRDAALVVLAAPPLACIDLLERLGADLRSSLAPGATVTDVASTKAALLAAAMRAGVPYVGGHPMAGRETSGFASADGDLLAGRPWVVTEAVAGGDPAVVEALAARCRATVVHLGAEEHDRLVAGISHLPLLAAVALVEAVAGTDEIAADWPAAQRLSATGWRDMTRLARGDPAMGAGIAASNAEALAARLRDYRDRIDAWIGLLEGSGTGMPGVPDTAGIEARLHAARRRLEEPPT
jgi:prephenate dehydrogenase